MTVPTQTARSLEALPCPKTRDDCSLLALCGVKKDRLEGRAEPSQEMKDMESRLPKMLVDIHNRGYCVREEESDARQLTAIVPPELVREIQQGADELLHGLVSSREMETALQSARHHRG